MKSLIENRKAKFDYEILETLEAGVVLTGQEVKSIKNGRANLVGSYVIIKPQGAVLLNTNISPYQPKNSPSNYDPLRSRQLLLHKDQLKYLLGKTKEGGLTVIPLSFYNKNRRIKISIGLARHKKKYDKREILKKRQIQKEMKMGMTGFDEH